MDRLSQSLFDATVDLNPLQINAALFAHHNPLSNNCINIISYNFSARLEESLVIEPWHLVVMDEAHKLRNAYRPNNKKGQALKRALFGRQKLLLTATPLQNSLLELYGLSTLLDEHIFGDDKSFRQHYMGIGQLKELFDRQDEVDERRETLIGQLESKLDKKNGSRRFIYYPLEFVITGLAYCQNDKLQP
ncbi:MAG: SNF2-related protein [Methylococcales bacterium]|nr:SNF2-related protein [Methylococcales bacterium]